MLAIGPITGYAAPNTDNQSDENQAQSTEVVTDESTTVAPPVSKKRVKQIFSAAKDYEPRELILSFTDTTSEAKQQEILKKYDLEIQSEMNSTQSVLVSTPRGKSIQDIANDLVQYKEVAYVQPNTKVTKSFVSQEPYYKKQWHLPKIDAPKAWDVTKGSSNVIVAVIDGGAQKDHPDLKHSIVSPMDIVTGSSDYIADDHGTHVAGIIAAAFNKYGTAGIAPNTKIMPVNVFEGEEADIFNIAKAIDYAVKNGANIINMSLGEYGYVYIEDAAIQSAVKKGVVVVAAAGNEDTNQNFYPAAYANVIAVSATDSDDYVSDFSNFGKYIDVAAPGVGILSTISGGRYAAYDGTSLAAPIVSGIAALVLAKNPFLTVGEVYNILKNSAIDYGEPGWDPFYGSGRVSASRALALTSQPISDFTSASSFTVTGKNRMNFSFTVPKNTKLTVEVRNANNKKVKSLISNQAWNGGKATVYWNGILDNGSFAGSGSYKFVVSISSAKGNFQTYKTIAIKNIMPATVTIPVTTYYSPIVQGKLNLPIRISNNTRVTAQIINAQDKVVKTLWNNASVSAGSRTIGWDGSKNSDGVYQIRFTAFSANNAKSITAGKIVVDRQAPALSVATDSTVFVANGTNTSNVRFNVKESVNVTINVVSENGEIVRALVNNQSYNASTPTLMWDGKDDQQVDVLAGNYHYRIQVKDQAGNVTTKETSSFNLQR